MYLAVDRIEKDTVLLQDDCEAVYTLPVQDYEVLVGRPPRESDILKATVRDGAVIAATPDDEDRASDHTSALQKADEERDSRLSRAAERLRRLMGK